MTSKRILIMGLPGAGKTDWTVWMDTIDQGRFEDTNRVFEAPTVYDFRITEQNAEKWAEFVTKIGLYWLHERVWNKISWGRF